MLSDRRVGGSPAAGGTGPAQRAPRLSLTLSVLSGHEAEMLEALRSVMAATQTEPACASVQVFQDVSEPQVFRYVEEWRQEEGLERRIRSRPFSRLLALMETASEAPLLEFFVGSEVRGLDYVAALRGNGAGGEKA